MRTCLKNGLVLLLLTSAVASSAADHSDGPAATNNPDADITDIYAWMDPSGKLNLVLNWFPDAPSGAALSDAVLFAFHVESKAMYGAMESTTTDILCGFDAAQKISCWAGDEYVTGDASASSGITSESGKLRVFAGDRNDPFFFNINGFVATVEAVTAAAGSLSFDPAGCPAVDSATSNALVTQLQSDTDGSAAKDNFAGQNVQSIVVQVDLSVVNAGGPILGVWASTHQR